MTQPFVAVPARMATRSAAEKAASTDIAVAGSADSAAMVGAVAAALGPIGAMFLAAYCPAQANNLAATLLVGATHAGIGAGTDTSCAAFVDLDSA